MEKELQPYANVRIAPPADPFPKRIEPMTAMPWLAPFSDARWLHEPKLDGWRLAVHLNDGEVRLLTRNGLDYTSQYSSIAKALRRRKTNMVLDGEIVALVDGKPSFSALSAGGTGPNVQVIFYYFDLLYLKDRNLCSLPLGERRDLMEHHVREEPLIRLVHGIPNGPALYDVMTEAGMEGIVSKRLAAPYQPGRRSPDWRKVKPFRSAEFIVVGYTRSGHGIGALLLAYWYCGRLKYAGKVSSGINAEVSKVFRQALEPLAKRRPIMDGPPSGQYVDPLVVVEVKYTELTPAGCVRHPVFLRVRPDVIPDMVQHPHS